MRKGGRRKGPPKCECVVVREECSVSNQNAVERGDKGREGVEKRDRTPYKKGRKGKNASLQTSAKPNPPGKFLRLRPCPASFFSLLLFLPFSGRGKDEMSRLFFFPAKVCMQKAYAMLVGVFCLFGVRGRAGGGAHRC